MPSATHHRARRNPSVWSSTQSVAATIAASGRSSWKFSSENTTKGAVPKKKAARRPDRASQRARPAPKVAARPTARKTSMTAWAVSGVTGKSR